MLDSVNGMAITNNKVYQTKDGWKTFEKINFPYKSVGAIVVWMHSPINYGFLVDDGASTYTTTFDNGVQWYSDSSLGDYNNSVYFLNDSIGWIAQEHRTGNGDQSADVIYQTSDGGIHWSKIYYDDSDTPIFGLQSIAFHDLLNGVAVGAWGKIIRTTNGGKSWSREYMEGDFPGNNQSLPSTMIVRYLGSTPVIGTFGYGVFMLEDVSDVSDTKKSSINAGLIKSMPNPFYDMITFKVTTGLPNSDVLLCLYDSKESLVKQEHFDLTQGETLLNLNNLGALPAGPYYYRLLINGKSFSGSLIKN